ncbi:hypothetical protein [Streptomyces scabiei]|uniref:hypothetical protein n=1 Tax=Streptomyces scabiei TaxID=1930 RepID=UPI001B3392FC|nr:hypothetical protein [Streptomyces sp. LBUM 1481]MBP5896366.1 hypothetical protein [Streptomyces sp. LBUM 1481]
MRLSLCKHAFPVQPPLGSLAHPGDCTGCGMTHDAHNLVLEEQEGRHRIATAARGRCEMCCLPGRMLFTFTPDPGPWDGDVGSHRLCTPCWSAAKLLDERGEPLTFTTAFDHGTDEQLLRLLGMDA